MSDRIIHNAIPDGVFVSFELNGHGLSQNDQDEQEAISGSTLIRRMAKKYFSVNSLEIYTIKNEKPKAFVGDNELSVSFSHTKNAISAAISFDYSIGCDTEHIGREVSPSIIKRIRADHENIELYEGKEAIRIWTCKEAALKMIGTGLRTPMNSVHLKKIDEYHYDVEFIDGIRAKICSFHHRDHWISVCYR